MPIRLSIRYRLIVGFLRKFFICMPDRFRLESFYRMIHDKKLLGACGETELANASNP
jgi:hypothetical protein